MIEYLNNSIARLSVFKTISKYESTTNFTPKVNEPIRYIRPEKPKRYGKSVMQKSKIE